MEQKIGFLGAGAMAEALAKGLLDGGLVKPAGIMMSDVSQERLALVAERMGVGASRDNRQVAAWADVLIFAVKPHLVQQVAAEAGQHLRPGSLVISIAAGITLADLERWLPQGAPVVRVMPNNPCQVQAGASALAAGSAAQAGHLELARQVFGAVGLALEVPERLLDAVTALSGSGPAYVYLFIEALSDAGVLVGLPRETAAALAVQTVLGSALMAKNSGRHPAQLKEMVTSPGGTTIAALLEMEEGGFRGTVMRAVEAACERARLLRQES